MNYYKKRVPISRQRNLLRIAQSSKNFRIQKKMAKYLIMQVGFNGFALYGGYEVGRHRELFKLVRNRRQNEHR